MPRFGAIASSHKSSWMVDERRNCNFSDTAMPPCHCQFFLCWPYAATSREISSPRKHMFHMSRHLFLLFPEKSGMANNECRRKDVHFTISISTTHSDHQNECFTGRKSLRCRREGGSRDRRFSWDWENGMSQLCMAVLEGLSFSPRLPPHL